MDFSFLQENLVYRLLTTDGNLDYFCNVLYICENSRFFDVYYPRPVLSRDDLDLIINTSPGSFIVQYGMEVPYKDFDDKVEALVITRRKKNLKRYVFLYRAS